MITLFQHKYGFLSNFHPSKIFYEGLWYPTVEHAYQAAKTTSIDHREEISKIPVNQPGKAKRKGRKIPLRAEWDDLFKAEVMEDLLRLKFADKNLKQKLLDTGTRDLVEGNYWHDNLWGKCFCKKCEDTYGYNVLGKLLMKLRKEYENESNLDR
jgi:ribA/ribD-fused uncharacterized protein